MTAAQKTHRAHMAKLMQHPQIRRDKIRLFNDSTATLRRVLAEIKRLQPIQITQHKDGTISDSKTLWSVQDKAFYDSIETKIHEIGIRIFG